MPFTLPLRSLLPWLLAALCGTHAPLQAQTAPVASAADSRPISTPATMPTPAPSADDLALLQAFGDRAGLQRLADDFVERLLVDARIGHFFKDVKPKHLKQQLADQFCAVMNGPCAYDGETMKNSHADLKVARKDFLALVEVLQQAMDARDIPFTAQNRLLAKLAPMHREIVTVR